MGSIDSSSIEDYGIEVSELRTGERYLFVSYTVGRETRGGPFGLIYPLLCVCCQHWQSVGKSRVRDIPVPPPSLPAQHETVTVQICT